MKLSKVKWFLAVFCVCLLYWLIDSVWSYFSFELNLRTLIFSEPRTLTDTFLLRLSPYQVVSRLTLTALIIVTGLLLYKYVAAIKLSEQRARASEERFRSFSEQSLVGLYILKDGIFTYVNPEFAEIFGYSVKECLDNINFRDLTHSEDLATVDEQIRRRVVGETPYTRYEFRGVRKDGQVVHLEIFGSTIRDQGELYATGTLLDITDRKLAEKSLTKSEERNRQILHTAMDGFCRLDNTGRLLEVNQTFCRMSGYEERELLAMNIADLEANDSPQDVAARMQMLTEKGSDRFESRHCRKDGSLLDVEISVQFRHANDGGEFVAFVCDITGRHKAEKEKERLEASLRQAQKLQAVGTLASGVAHEFNNLLAAIMGYAGKIFDTAGNRQDLASDAAQIQLASERGRELVRNILSFTRNIEPQTRLLDLNSEIRKSKDMLVQLLPRTISIETRLAPNLGLVSMDASHLSQVLMNLTTNACHAMPDGGKLVIKTENAFVEDVVCFACGEKFSGDYVHLSFTDTGHGMDAETIQRIYEPFFSTKDVGSGTGLGLSVVQGLVKTHGGHIACTSEVGRGTTFNIFLPINKSEGTALVAEDVAQPAMVGGNETILLVDDEESLSKIAQLYFSEMGYLVHQAGSGEKALEIYQQHQGQIDLVVLDLGMPGMGGHKCLKEILAINPQAKVVVASGYTTDGQDRQALSAGAAAFVGKPFKMNELLKTVRDVLDKNEHHLDRSSMGADQYN